MECTRKGEINVHVETIKDLSHNITALWNVLEGGINVHVETFKDLSHNITDLWNGLEGGNK